MTKSEYKQTGKFKETNHPLWRWSPWAIAMLSILGVASYKLLMDNTTLDTLRQAIETWHPGFICYTLGLTLGAAISAVKTGGWKRFIGVALVVFNFGFLCFLTFLYSRIF